jgi:hypothetical protein
LSYGAQNLDASLLLLPLVGFLPADDPRIEGTVAAIERSLLKDGFVARYKTESTVDGLPGDEGAFVACSLWLADNYICRIGIMTLARCSSGSSRSATMSVCSPKNTIRGQASRWATTRKPSLMSR